MYILGDIGNSETKIFLVSKNNKIIKKIILSSNDINYNKLNSLFINRLVLTIFFKLLSLKSSSKFKN